MKKIQLGKFKRKEKNTSNKNNTQVKNIILSTILIGGIAVISLVLVFALYIIVTSPDFDKEKLYSKDSSVLYYNDGVTELARLGNYDRKIVTYDELPQVLVDAIVATEDSRFFQHNGLDVARFLKASIGQVLGRDAGGASTLTMQVVKRAYTSSQDKGIEGIIRKFTDIYMSIFKVESSYTKEEIIEFYVNSQWFAHDGNLNSNGIAGVELASQYFFGKSVSDINLAEASIIAGMFQNPSMYDPYRHPERLAKRQKTVLTLMVNHGYITEEQKNDILEIPVESLLVERKIRSNDNQATIEYVMDEVKRKTGHDPRTEAMKIVTTIDKNVQDVVNQLEKGEIYKFAYDEIQEGIAITSTENGAVVALSGGRNYGAQGTNRATAKRQPGSTAKILFDYGPYLEYLGGSPETLFLDEETKYSNGQSIKNSNGKYNGLMTMRQALVKSRNIPALRAFKAVNAEKQNYIENFVHSLGINYGPDLYESASIGGFDGASPMQMSAAYAAFGRGGYYIEPYSYKEATIIETGEKFEYNYEKVQVMSEETAYMITDMLISTAESGVGMGTSISGTDIAAKSGTSNLDKATTDKLGIPANSTRDSWSITYSPEYSIAVWIGYDQTTSKNYLNLTIGNQIRKGVMKAVGTRVYSKNRTFEKPSSVIEVEVEDETFPLQLASEFTPSSLRKMAMFKEGTEPTEVSTRYSKLASPTGGSYSFDGTTLKLTWNRINTPDAINQTYLQEHFNTYYDLSAQKYYEARLSYNNSYIGTLGYRIYQKNSDGTLTYIGMTENPNFTINNPTSGNVTYVIKSSYSIFTNNMSDGLEINTNNNIDSNIGDIMGGNDQDQDQDIPLN